VPPTAEPTTTIDYSAVTLTAVPGRSKTTVEFGTGKATLNGSVAAPDGTPVPAATVHVERLVDSAVASKDVMTQPDGTWTLAGIPGGLYRVRAYRPPDLAQVDPDVFFLANRDTRSEPLHLARYGGYQVTAAIAPNPPIVNESANIAVQLATSSVDDSGVVRASAVPNVVVELVGSDRWQLDGPNEQTTNDKGQARWSAVCREAGNQPLSLAVGADQFPLDLPPCATPATSTTAGPATSERTTTTRRFPLGPATTRGD